MTCALYAAGVRVCSRVPLRAAAAAAPKPSRIRQLKLLAVCVLLMLISTLHVSPANLHATNYKSHAQVDTVSATLSPQLSSVDDPNASASASTSRPKVGKYRVPQPHSSNDEQNAAKSGRNSASNYQSKHSSASNSELSTSNSDHRHNQHVDEFTMPLVSDDFARLQGPKRISQCIEWFRQRSAHHIQTVKPTCTSLKRKLSHICTGLPKAIGATCMSVVQDQLVTQCTTQAVYQIMNYIAGPERSQLNSVHQHHDLGFHLWLTSAVGKASYDLIQNTKKYCCQPPVDQDQSAQMTALVHEMQHRDTTIQHDIHWMATAPLAYRRQLSIIDRAIKVSLERYRRLESSTERLKSEVPEAHSEQQPFGDNDYTGNEMSFILTFGQIPTALEHRECVLKLMPTEAVNVALHDPLNLDAIFEVNKRVDALIAQKQAAHLKNGATAAAAANKQSAGPMAHAATAAEKEKAQAQAQAHGNKGKGTGSTNSLDNHAVAEALHHLTPSSHVGEIVNFINKIRSTSLSQDLATKYTAAMLVGPSGVGKTYFLESLARVLGIHVCSASLNAGLLVGRHAPPPVEKIMWGGSQEAPAWAGGRLTKGIIGRCAREAGHTNFIVFFDEVDPYLCPDPHDRDGGHWVAEFKLLLDGFKPSNPHIRRLGDIGLEFNTQQVTFVGASNKPLQDEALKTRMQTFVFPKMSYEERFVIYSQYVNSRITPICHNLHLTKDETHAIHDAMTEVLPEITKIDVALNPGAHAGKSAIQDLIRHEAQRFQIHKTAEAQMQRQHDEAVAKGTKTDDVIQTLEPVRMHHAEMIAFARAQLESSHRDALAKAAEAAAQGVDEGGMNFWQGAGGHGGAALAPAAMHAEPAAMQQHMPGHFAPAAAAAAGPLMGHASPHDMPPMSHMPQMPQMPQSGHHGFQHWHGNEGHMTQPLHSLQHPLQHPPFMTHFGNGLEHMMLPHQGQVDAAAAAANVSGIDPLLHPNHHQQLRQLQLQQLQQHAQPAHEPMHYMPMSLDPRAHPTHAHHNMHPMHEPHFGADYRGLTDRVNAGHNQRLLHMFAAAGGGGGGGEGEGGGLAEMHMPAAAAAAPPSPSSRAATQHTHHAEQESQGEGNMPTQDQGRTGKTVTKTQIVTPRRHQD